ncbi:MAG: fused MFS/spermidine synthase [Gammaproteobacteria bacterium]|nr:fused MFS/spermidine synthase [Gammaproteobacteria bacterium]MDH3766943.1 fused MFS/spermidine synthase [Gammaproteobacteria bacterium]
MIRCCIAVLLLGLTGSLAAEVILHTEKSLYRNIEVFEDGDIRCLRFTVRRRESRQSCIDPDEPDRLVLPYTPVAFGGLLINPAPKRVLLVGLGGGTIANVFARLYPGISIDAVEIDPAVIEVARNYFNFAERAGTRVFAQDGRVYARRALRNGARYDYILVDAFDGDYIPEHLMTAEFLEECRQLLTNQGVLVANTFSSSRLYNSESATYESVFGDFLNLRRRFSNRVIVAAKNGLPSPGTLKSNIALVEANLARFDIDLEQILALDRGKDWRGKARVLTDQYAPANLLRGRNDD